MPQTAPEKVVLSDKFNLFEDAWNPRIVAELNGQHVKVARLDGPFIWHHHDDEDELFLVIEGHLSMELRDRTIELHPGEMLVVPRGVEHRPVAHGEVKVVLFEPATTRNTGDLDHELTRQELEHI